MSNEVMKETGRHAAGKQKVGLWIGVGLIAILVIGFISAPTIAEGFIKNNIDKFLGIEGVQTVDMKASAFQLLGGKFDALNIKGEDLLFGQLNVSSYAFSAATGDVDIWKIISQKKILVKNNQLIDVTLQVEPQDFKALLEKYYPSLQEMELTFGEGVLHVSGIANTTSGLRVPLAMTSTVQSEDWSSLQVDVQNIDVQGQVTADVKQELEQIFNVRIPFDHGRLPIYIDQVSIDPNGLLIKANSTFTPQV